MAAQVASGPVVPPPPPPPAPPLPPAPAARPPQPPAAPVAGPGPGSAAAAQRRPNGAAPQAARQQAKPKPKPKPAAAAAPAPRQVSGLDVRLRRETPFICNMRFKTDLPEIPADPKMLVAPLHGEQLGQFFISSLEHEPRRDLVLAPDLGIPIAVMDIGRYDVQDTAQLDHADAALLRDDPGLRAPVKNDSPLKVRRFAARNTEVSWLMRTTYISAHDDQRKRATQAARHQPLVQDEETSREKQIAMIEATFEAAQQPPRHHKDPKLRPVQVMPLLPDFERWANKLVRVHFDADPTEESDALAKVADSKLRHALAERSMLKTFRPKSMHEETALAMLVPQQALAAATAGEPLPPAEEASDLEGDYMWDKEYTHTIMLQDDTQPQNQEDVRYLLRLDPEAGTATYCSFAGKVTLRKRKRRDDDDPPPAKATVRSRPYSEEELQDRRDRRIALEGEDNGM